MTRLPTALPENSGRTETPAARPRATLLIAAAGTFLALAVYCAPLGNLPTIAAALSAGPIARTWILSSMSIGLAAVLLTVGALADDHGRRRVFVIGIGALVAGSLACAVAGGPALFIAGRVLQGIGAAGVIAAGLGLIAQAFVVPAQRAAATGVWGAAVGAGITVGPLLAGLLDLGGLWRWFYWALLPIGAVLILVTRARVAESKAEAPRPIDLPGAITLSAAMVALLLAMVAGRQRDAGVVLVTGIAAAVLIAGFISIELRRRAPMLDLALFRRPRFTAATIAALATGIGVIGLMSFACTFLVTTLRMSTLQAAGLLAIWSGLSVVAALLARRLPAALTGSRQLAIGLAGVGVGLLTMIGLAPGASPWDLLPGLVIAGVASGVLNAGLGREAVASVPADRAGLGSGANNTARYLGSSIGVTVVGIIATDPRGTAAGMIAGWDHAAAVAGLVSLAGAAAVVLLTRRPGGRHHRAEGNPADANPAGRDRSERPVDRPGALLPE
ncbi:MFS transporter [Nakamurella lactea]|uniref:MFS transporter n=1 Tax=Nakamurella lactea TaxID=459515 RepID=UPI00042553AE|nr:MFS transporter [Nakamurella lactea]